MMNLNTRVGATSTGFIMTWDREQWRNLENTIMNFLTNLATISFSRSLLHGPKRITLRHFRLTPWCKCDLRFLRMLRSADQQLLTFRDNLSVPASRARQSRTAGTLKMGAAQIGSQRRFGTINPHLQGSSSPIFFSILQDGTNGLFRNVGNYQSTLRNIPEQRRSQLEIFAVLGSLLIAASIVPVQAQGRVIPGVVRGRLLTTEPRVQCRGLHVVQLTKEYCTRGFSGFLRFSPANHYSTTALY